MNLTSKEIVLLIDGKIRDPHGLLGLHLQEGKKGGLVGRAMLPGARRVTVKPVPGHDGAEFELKCLHKQGLFEGTTTAHRQIFAYDLEVEWEDGHCTRSRDPYSFLPTLTDQDMYLFGKGEERRLYDKLGAQVRQIDGVWGTSFAVWAPNAARVSVVGNFNQWDGRRHPLRLLGGSGVWEIFIPDVMQGDLYKFEILDAHGHLRLKTDPVGFAFELAPANASIVWDVKRFEWEDESWMESRRDAEWLKRPMSIYELHLGSWKKKSGHESLNYRELAGPLIAYLSRMGFTHVEFLPVAEHAFYPCWGYQVTGFFAPTCRYGTPDDFQYLVNALHMAGIGVLMDWVPAHFPRDDWALARFDGTALYEHEDPRQGAHQDWGTLIFNYGRHEVRNFLTANALFWAERFHVDGLRVDAVASMLYLDYSRKEGEWVPNEFGGRENLEAVSFLRNFNEVVHLEHPGLVTIAEESTAWPQVSRPTYLGGLGFDLKWNMGWMHDTLGYFQLDPVFRKYHQNDLTFAMLYHFHENFILPLSHDEVVHGKGSLLGKMPGDDWRKFANLRCLLAYQWMFPGKKLLFMGGELGQRSEWNENTEIDWWLLESGPYHKGTQKFMADLNRVYREYPAAWELDYEGHGFQWIDCCDHEQSVLSFMRRSAQPGENLVVVLNLTPVVRRGYRVGFPTVGAWDEVLNSDSGAYGGSNVGNGGRVHAESPACHGQAASVSLTLPPLGVLVFAPSPAGPQSSSVLV